MSTLVTLSQEPILQFTNSDGSPLAGGTLTTLVGGIPYPTYSDPTGTFALPNPIILNSRGEVATNAGTSSPLYVSGNVAYTFILQDALGNTIWVAPSIASSVTTLDTLKVFLTADLLAPIENPQTTAELSVAISPSNFSYKPGQSARYGADGTGVSDATAALQTWINATWAIYNYSDSQGLWNGGGGAIPVAQLLPGKYKLSGPLTIPSCVTIRGTGHPANTTNHTRLVMDSTGITPARVWSAGATIPKNANIQARSGGALYRYSSSGGGSSGGAMPTWTTSGTVSDGSVTWVNSGLCTATDNRNMPLVKFSRATKPGSTTIADQYFNSTLENLEFWSVTYGNSFDAPLNGASPQFGDYPLGGAIYIDVDVIDTRIINCCFQNTPCGVRINNVTTGTTGGDGITNTGLVSLFVEKCEFDVASAHVVAGNSNLDLQFRNCDFYGGIHVYANCTGKVVYDNCRFYGGTSIDASSSANNFSLIRIGGGEFEMQNIYDNINIYGANVVDIKDITMYGAGGTSAIVVQLANSGSITGMTIDNAGFNSPATTGLTASAAIKLIDCQNMGVTSNNITATNLAGSYNGFGIMTLSNLRASQKNFINNNCISAPYSGSPVNNQGRRLNLATGDIAGINYDPNGWIIQKQAPVANTRTQVTYAQTIALNAAIANIFEILVTSNSAFTMAAPTNPSEGQIITLTFLNTSGATMGAITWDSVFKVATFQNPANGANRSIMFEYNGTNWKQLFVGTVDIPN